MEFNRLLSSAISAYGEPKLSGSENNFKSSEKQKPINNKDYHLITDINEIDKWIEEAEEVGWSTPPSTAASSGISRGGHSIILHTFNLTTSASYVSRKTSSPEFGQSR